MIRNRDARPGRRDAAARAPPGPPSTSNRRGGRQPTAQPATTAPPTGTATYRRARRPTPHRPVCRRVPTPYAPAPAATPPGGTLLPPPTPAAPRPPRPPKCPAAGAVASSPRCSSADWPSRHTGDARGSTTRTNWAGSDQTVALAAALGVFGPGILGDRAARAARRLTGFIAVVLAFVTWTASVVPDVTFGGGIGERVWRPSATDTTAKLPARHRLGRARPRPAPRTTPGPPDEIDARVGIGELRIRIPSNLTVEVRSSVAAGDISPRRTPASFDRCPPLAGRRPSTTRRPTRRPQHQHRPDLRQGTPTSSSTPTSASARS